MLRRWMEKRINSEIKRIAGEHEKAESNLINAIQYWKLLPKESNHHTPWHTPRENIIEAGDELCEAIESMMRFYRSIPAEAPRINNAHSSLVFAEGGKGSEWINREYYLQSYLDWEKQQNSADSE